MTTASPTRDEILDRLNVRALYAEILPGFRVNGATGDAAVRCPFHEDRNPSMSVNVETGLFNCHGCGAKGSPVDMVMRTKGLETGAAIRWLRDYVGLAAPSAKASSRKRVNEPWPRLRDGHELVTTYSYTLDGEKARALKARYAEPNGEKTFLWFEADPEGGYWSRLEGKEPDLYQLDKVRAGIERGALIILNEGEKAVDRAALHDGDDCLDFVATCGPNGFSSFHKTDGFRLATQLRGAAEVVAVVDRDDRGREWAEDVRQWVGPVVGKLRFVQAALDTPKADLFDHLEAGLGIGELVPFALPKAAAVEPTPATLSEVVSTFRRWQYLPDPRPLYVVLAAYVANRLEGEPLWLLVVAPPSSGKTETINAIAGLDFVRSASTLTEASLLSGTVKRDRAKDAKGGLLREIGDFGILLVKDFTSILSMHRDARAAVLAALREVYDGSYTRNVGSDGGRTLSWSGRIGFVGGVTAIIDRHHAVLSALGERFLYLRLPEVSRKDLGRMALRHSRSGSRMRKELAEAVSGLMAGIRFDVEPPEIGDEEADRLVAVADFVTAARSAVERDGHTREVELIPGAEAPGRFAIGLSRLLSGLRAIGLDDRTAWSCVYRVALDSIPAIRRKVLDVLANTTAVTTREVAEEAGYPTATARRALEDVAIYGLVRREGAGERSVDRWYLADHARPFLSVPDLSEDVQVEAVSKDFEPPLIEHEYTLEDFSGTDGRGRLL